MILHIPTFRWAPFLISFVSAPLLVTLCTFWLLVPVFALMLGGPLYLIIGLPLAAWYLRRPNPGWIPAILMAQVGQTVQIPIFYTFAWATGDWHILDALPAFLTMGALFAALWTVTFLLLYHLATSVKPPVAPKEYPDAIR